VPDRTNLVGTALALLLVLACAGTSADSASEPRSVIAGTAVKNAVILPINVTTVTPVDLEPPLSPVWAGIDDYLRANAVKLRTIDFKVARQFWLGSIKQVRERPGGSETGFDDAARVLIKKLSAHAEFDTLLVPTVYLTEAPIEQNQATWDGVTRTVRVESNSLAGTAVAEEVPLEGLAPAASLHMVVLDADGNRIQEGRGGLDLMVDVRVKHNPYGETDEPIFQYIPRADALADPAHVREGIALSLSPFLPALLPSEPDAPSN